MSAQLQTQSFNDAGVSDGEGVLAKNKTSSNIKTGFNAPVFDSQSVFRKILKSMSEPGVISTIDKPLDKPQPLNTASYAIALALFDHDTAIALSDSLNEDEVLATLRFHCSSAILNDLKTVDFILCDETEIPKLSELKLGTESYPDDSCTLIIQVQNIEKREGWVLKGAGIQDKHLIQSSAITNELVEQRNKLQKLFPMGVDLIFTCEESFFCLPRTTLLEKEDSSCT